jgi:RNA polymerase sigma-70 factor (ECF subfamily)
MKLEQETQDSGKAQFSNEEAVELIRKMSSGDKAALTNLYEKTNPLVFGLILKILGNPILADEVLLDVYTHLWRQSTVFDPERLAPLEWLVTVARNSAITRLHWSRQDKRRRKFSNMKKDPATTVEPERQKCARSSLESLVPTQQEILEWVYYSGLSCSEIATHIGKPLGAVKTHTRLGMSKLSELFRPLYGREI